MKKSIFIFLILLGSISFGQKLKVEAVYNDFEKVRASSHFDYLHDSLDIELCTWVADFTITFDTVIPGILHESFMLFKEKSNGMGANAFRVTSSDIYHKNEDKFISISVYWLKMEDRDKNHKYFMKPKIHLFGLLGYHKKISGYDVKVNDDEFILSELRYRSYPFKIGEQVHLQQGKGIRGDSKKIVFEEKNMSRYFYFTKISGALRNSFIHEYKMNFGEFLISILEKDN